jgi:hypothetical protein
MKKLFSINSMALIVAVLSLAWAVWSGYLDHKPHSLEFKLLSQAAIQPKETGAISGIQVTVDGIQVESPYLSVLELRNNGSKPIPKSDFEAPLELRVGSGVMVVRAQVTSTNPKDIEANLETNQNVVKLSPLLINPDDTITISVLTAGKSPAFSPRARIADITILSLRDDTKKSSNIFEKIFLVILIPALFLSSTCMDTIIRRRNDLIDLWPARFISVTIIITASYMLIKFASIVSTTVYWSLAVAIVIPVFLTVLWSSKTKARY